MRLIDVLYDREYDARPEKTLLYIHHFCNIFVISIMITVLKQSKPPVPGRQIQIKVRTYVTVVQLVPGLQNG